MKKTINSQKVSKVLLSLAVVSSASFFAFQPKASAAVDEMVDISQSHWSYKAIKELVDKYGVMGGFPDRTFRGSRNFTRYEAAAALYKVMLKMEEMMSNGGGGFVPGAEDMIKLKELSTEFIREIDALKVADVEKAEKIKKLEDDLKALKEKMDKVELAKKDDKITLSGYFETGLKDTWEDTIRPDYSTYYEMGLKAKIDENLTLRGTFSGSFSSKEEEKQESGESVKKDVEKANVGFGQAWFDYNAKDAFLRPRVKIGYMGMGKLVGAGTSITNYFPGVAGLASPDLNNGDRKRGIRGGDSVTAGVDLGMGPFSMAVAANPNIFATQLALNFDLVKIKLAADADQAMFVGEAVQDTVHNEALVIDIGNDKFGVSLQGNARGLADDWQWRAASALLYMNLFDVEFGGTAKFENESTQQVVAGGFLKTPSKIGDVKIPSLIIAAQTPLTLLDDGMWEGSKLGDKAGFAVRIEYDNPVLPNFQIFFDQKSNVLFPSDPKDIISNTYGIKTSMGF